MRQSFGMRHWAVALGLAALVVDARADSVDKWLSGQPDPGPPAAAYGGPAIEAKFGHPTPPASLLPPVWQRSFDRLAKASNQKLLVKQFGGGTLIGPRDGFKAVRANLAQWATCYVQNEGRSLRLSRVFEQPFVAPANPMAGVRILQELAPKYFVPEFRKQGVVWGSAISAMPTDLLSKKPVRRWEDLAGLKIIAQGFPPELARVMGVTIVNVPYPESYLALQQGLADAMFWVDAGFIPYKLFEVARHHTSLGITGFTINHCYNPQFFESLPPGLQTLFSNAQEPMAMAAAKIAMVDFRKTALATYRDQGVELITLAPAEMQRWRELAAPAVEQWATELEDGGLPARALLADVKRLTRKYDAMTPDQLMELSVANPVKGLR